MSGAQIIPAIWTGFEVDAEWNRVLARCLREHKNHDAAMAYLRQAVKLNPQLWLAQAGIAKIFRDQEDLEESIEADQDALKLAAAENEKTGKDKNLDTGRIHEALAQCYQEVADDIVYELPNADMTKVLEYYKLALNHYTEAYELNNSDHASMSSCIGILHFFANPGLPLINDESTKQEAQRHHFGLQSTMDYQRQIMDLLYHMAETQKNETHSSLTKCIFVNEHPDGYVFKCIAEAANATYQLEWLQGRYSAAMSAAAKDRRKADPDNLSLCMAELYVISRDEPDKAISIWERIGMKGSGSHDAWTRRWALEQLGKYCLGTALRDVSKVEPVIPRLERIVFQWGHGDRDPFSYMANYLAFWYRKYGMMDEARQLVGPNIMNAVLMLPEDNASEDEDMLIDLSRAFLAVGDVENFQAAMHASRQYRAGLAVLEGDEEDKNNAKPEMNDCHDIAQDHDSQSDDSDDLDDVGECDGPCGRELYLWDGVTSCLICGDFCEIKGCYKKLLAGKIPGKTCSENYDAVYVPVLKTRFKEGETMLGDRIITLDEWKAGLEKQWG